MAAWIGGLSFSLVVGALADSVGYGPLFACLGAFDLIGAALLVLLIRGQSKRDRALAGT
jgi:ACS family hexuronate transporter-like MFS transporter